jgi:hypothetical protein
MLMCVSVSLICVTSPSLPNMVTCRQWISMSSIMHFTLSPVQAGTMSRQIEEYSNQHDRGACTCAACRAIMMNRRQTDTRHTQTREAHAIPPAYSNRAKVVSRDAEMHFQWHSWPLSLSTIATVQREARGVTHRLCVRSIKLGHNRLRHRATGKWGQNINDMHNGSSEN